MNSNSNDNLKFSRHGFTLVEMLFVVAIIAVLAAMAAGILGKAKKDADIAATRSRITQIEAIMQTVTEDFEVQRLPFRNSELALLIPPGRDQRSLVKNYRRRISAALLLAEFPGALTTDGTNFDTNPHIGRLVPAGAPPTRGSATGQNFRTWAEDNGLLPLLNAIDAGRSTADMQFWQSLAGDRDLDLPGEYLYSILERLNIDGNSALESLGPNVVANTDEDDFPEIVDAFGDSMQLRIVQVADVTSEQTNWKQFEIINGIKLPMGYELLDPTEARSTNQIRFQVVSQTLEEIE